MIFALSCNGITHNAEVITSSFSKNEIYWNKLKQADNSARFQAVFTIELANFLKTNINKDIQCTIIDGDINVFFGFIRKNITFSKTQINQPIAIEVVSPSFLLDGTIGNSRYYVDKTIGYIVEDLLSVAGFNSSRNLTALDYAPRFVGVSSDDTYKTVITELLFEYGYGWDFDNDGIFYTYELFNVPETSEITNTFNGSNCLKEIEITATDQEYDSIRGTYNEISEHENILIFSDTTGAESSSNNSCNQPVDPSSYFLKEKYNYLETDSEKGEVAYIFDITPEVEASSSVSMRWEMSCKELDETSPDYNKPLGNRLCFTAYNSSPSINTLTKINCKGHILAANAKTSVYSYGNLKENEIELKYISEEAKAREFIENVTNWYRYANNTISLTSKENYPLGSFVKVTDYGIGTYYGRIIQKQHRLNTDSISYTIETVDIFEPAVIDKQVTPAIGGINQSSLASAVAQSNQYTDNAIQQVELQASPQYSVVYNTPVIRKGNDGAYSPSIIKATAYKTTDIQVLFSGDFEVKLNGENYGTFQTSSIELSIDDLLQSVDAVNTIEISFKTSGANPLVISQYTIPVISGASAYSVALENPGTIFEADASGNVTAHSVTTKAHVYYGLQELEYLSENGWEYGFIEAPEGFNVTVDAATGIITISNNAGNLPDYGKITIPVFIHSQSNTEFYAGYEKDGVTFFSGYGENFEGYLSPDESGYFNAYFTFQKLKEGAIKLAELNDKVNRYWNTLTDDLVITVAEKNTLRRLLDGIIAEFAVYAEKYTMHKAYTSYASAYTSLKAAVENVLSYSGNYSFDSVTDKNNFNALFENYYSKKELLDVEIASIATNYKNVREASQINTLAASAKVNDYFVWTGADNTIVGGISFKTGLIYRFDGSFWVTDNSDNLILNTMQETLNFISDSTDENIPAVNFAKTMGAAKALFDTVFTNELIIRNKLTSDNFDGVIDTEGHVSNLGRNGFAFTKAGEIIGNKGWFRGGLGTSYEIENNSVMNDPSAGTKLVIIYAHIEYGVFGTNAEYSYEPLLLGVSYYRGYAPLHTYEEEPLYGFFKSDNLRISIKQKSSGGIIPHFIHMNNLRYTGEHEDELSYRKCLGLKITEMKIVD